MTHFVVLIIIPQKIFQQGAKAINDYIDNVMKQYSETLSVEPYICLTKEELIKNLDEFNQKNNDQYTMKEFVEEYLGHKLDEDGNAISTFNKNAIYDWFVVGGRWDGHVLPGTIPQYSDNGFNFADKHHTVKNNSCTIKDFIATIEDDEDKNVYDHLIDKYGKLHRLGKVGWFATFETEVNDIDWTNFYKQVLNEAYDDYIVNLDCHT